MINNHSLPRVGIESKIVVFTVGFCSTVLLGKKTSPEVFYPHIVNRFKYIKCFLKNKIKNETLNKMPLISASRCILHTAM